MGDKYGAFIERGKVMDMQDGKYRIESLSRLGITTPLLKASNGIHVGIGNVVYFFMFDDGDGLIVAALS